MKNTLLALTANILFATAAIAQIPNGGFETWTSTGTYDSPTGWANFNSATSMVSVYTCLKGTPGNPGSAYLKLVTKNAPGLGLVPGMAVSGTMNMDMEPESGFAYNQRPTALVGNWQHMGYGGDEGLIAVYLTKWNSVTGSRDTVGKAARGLGAMVMSWASFSIPITYSGSSNPDSAMIVLSSSGTNPVENSYLYVDNLSFSGVTGINEVKLNAQLNIYPNPVSTGELTVKLEGVNAPVTTVQLFDLQGKETRQFAVKNLNGTLTLDIADLSKGPYIIKLVTAEGVAVSRFVKQ